MVKGRSYILVLKLDRESIVEVGALGKIVFKPGYYLYVGSAKVGVSRICRHFRREKKLKWHIDYLSVVAEPLHAYLFHREECDVAAMLAERFECIPRFGCSDCLCRSHLFYSAKLPTFHAPILRPEDCR
ncbi:GIY-YIG nuclease family protein [Archaeoglobus veneficus]|uniref:GIY-YIG domain-containing protein n=1 Tax=Archaeoglobus veneficus (strain DSM 11195 / SNP6) TaxID=693661 RepID=F2KN43_ARCVS|nr:DUF123 domain-containing protein [Archaeoglobus veneficus]AEA46144.1 protein of unknown function DUF123 [Archaeoglobus veneficus SNP6]